MDMAEEIDFKELMAKKSDEALNHYLLNIRLYVPEATCEAFDELKRRGKDFTVEELRVIVSELQKKEVIRKQEDKKWLNFNPLYLGAAVILLYFVRYFYLENDSNAVWKLMGVIIIAGLFYYRRKKPVELKK